MKYTDELNKLVLFDAEGTLLKKVAAGLDDEENLPKALSLLINEAYTNGWQGNLWHTLILYSLVMSENPFSLSCERKRVKKSSLWDIALSDMDCIMKLWDAVCVNSLWNAVTDFTQPDAVSTPDLEILTDSFERANGDCEQALRALASYYESSGCGIYGSNDSFRIEDGAITPNIRTEKPVFSDLVGYEEQKAKLKENTENFIAKRGSNNVLLYGDAGTGKSTSIQALLSEYSKDGLRIIEVYKHQFELIPGIMAKLADRNYSFILLLDDLSFEESETEYKYLKAVMEGGSAVHPENVRIYATSNRRHLIRENYSDRSDMEHDGDIHRSETMEEKLSLAMRFGLQIFYPAPTFKEYQGIVESLAKRAGLDEASAELFRASAEWQIAHGSKSGRTAKQFVDSLKTDKQ